MSQQDFAEKEFFSYEDIASIVRHSPNMVDQVEGKGLFFKDASSRHKLILHHGNCVEIGVASGQLYRTGPRPKIISHFCFRQKLVEIPSPNCIPDALILHGLLIPTRN